MVRLKERYVNALLELSEENGALENDLEQAVLIRNALSDADIQDFLIHPHVPDSAKHKLFQDVFSDKLSKHLTGFLYIMVQKNRELLIVPVLEEYIELINRRLGRIEAKVVSAKALTEKQIESIRIILSKQTNMQVEMKVTVDPDVIGGFYIMVDGRIFDGTLRSELHSMKECLKRGSYKC